VTRGDLYLVTALRFQIKKRYWIQMAEESNKVPILYNYKTTNRRYITFLSSHLELFRILRSNIVVKGERLRSFAFQVERIELHNACRAKVCQG